MIDPDGCYFHGDGCYLEHPYIVCFECGHCYTRRSLRRAYWKQSRFRSLYEEERIPIRSIVRYQFHRAYWWIRPSRIFFCQECIHNF